MCELNKRGRVQLVIVLMLLGVLLAGCRPAGSGADNSSSGSAGSAPANTQAAAISYLVVNPLEEVVLEESSSDTDSRRRLAIDGLRDPEVEGSINQRLEMLYEELRNGSLPPYRGIRRAIPVGAEETYTGVWLHLSFNHNNVLSVLARDDRRFAVGEEYTTHTGRIEPLTFDLNTGRELQLRDLFAEGTDYLTLLSDSLYKQLSGSEDEWTDRLVAPFTGIKEDQKFYLGPQGITLVMDYDTPEFAAEQMAIEFHIPFSDVASILDITRQFYDPEVNIYESDAPPVYQFVHVPSAGEALERQELELEGLPIELSCSRPSDMSEITREKVEELLQLRSDFFLPLWEEALQVGADADTVWASQHVWVLQSGPYTCLSQEVGFVAGEHESRARSSYCYDASGRLLELSDVFREGVDIDAMLIAAMEEKLQYTDVGEEDIDPAALLPDIQFIIGVSEIEFCTRSIDWRGVRDGLYFSISYADIGCENLRIFDGLE